MIDWSKPLSEEQKEMGRKFRRTWQLLLSADEKISVSSRYYTTDTEHVNPGDLATGKEKLCRAGYPESQLSSLIDLSMHPDCWTEEELQEFLKRRLASKRNNA